MAALVGMIGVVKSWNWMLDFSSLGGVLYRIFKNVFLFLALFLAAVTLWKRYSWSSLFGSIISNLTAIWFWVDRILISQNPLPFRQQILPLMITFILVTFILLSLIILQPHIVSFNNSKNKPPMTNPIKGGEDEQSTP